MDLHTQHSHLHTQQREVIQPVTQWWTFTFNTHTFTLNKEKLYSQSHSNEPSHSTLTPSHSTKSSYTASHTVMNLHTLTPSHSTKKSYTASHTHSDEPSHSTLTPSHATKKSYTASHTHSDQPSHSHLHTQQRVVMQPVTHMAMNLHTQHSHRHTQQRVVIQPVTHSNGPSRSTKSSTTTWRLFNTWVCRWSSLNLLVWWVAGW